MSNDPIHQTVFPHTVTKLADDSGRAILVRTDVTSQVTLLPNGTLVLNAGGHAIQEVALFPNTTAARAVALSANLPVDAAMVST